MKSLVVYIGLLLLAPTLTHAACDSFWSSNELNSFIALLNKVDQGPTWRSFKITNHPIVVTNAETHPTCAVIYLDGRVVSKMSLSIGLLQPEPINLENVIQSLPKELTKEQRQAFIEQIMARFSRPFDWGFIDPNIPNVIPPPPSEFKDVLNKLGHFSAVAVSLHSAGTDTERLMSTIAHEGFHHFYQGSEKPEWERSRYPWPTWSQRVADVGSTVEQCYKAGQKVIELHIAENHALLDAVLNAQSGKRSQAVSLIRKFLELRRLRSEIVKNNSVKSRNSGESSVTCAFAEASLELVEGSAQFVGVDTLIKSGLLSINDFVKVIDTSNQSSESWYRSGALQLLFAKTLLIDVDFQAMLSRIEKSPDDSSGLTFEIEKIVNSMDF